MTKATKESYTDELGSLFGDLAKDDDALATFSDNDLGETKDWVPTLIPALDKNLVAGIPASGEISEIFGGPSAGKSTFAGLIMHNAQKMGIVPIYFDVETTQRASRLMELGVDPRFVMTVGLHLLLLPSLAES